MTKRIVIGVVLLIIVIQLLQPTKNKSEGISENDISHVYALPDGLHDMLVQKCYDCHSNNTRYPWYVHIQPIGWWLASHVKEGKEHLNFSEFKTYEKRKADHKLEELVEVLEAGEMPLKSYLLMHGDANVTTEETQMIKTWVKSLGVAVE